MALRYIRLRGRGLRRKRGLWWVVWPGLQHPFRRRRVVPRHEAEELGARLAAIRRGGYRTVVIVVDA